MIGCVLGCACGRVFGFGVLGVSGCALGFCL